MSELDVGSIVYYTVGTHLEGTPDMRSGIVVNKMQTTDDDVKESFYRVWGQPHHLNKRCSVMYEFPWWWIHATKESLINFSIEMHKKGKSNE